MASGTSTSEMNCDGRHVAEHDAALVAAEELDDEPRDAVEHHVAPERAALERPPLLLGPSSSTRISASRRALVQLRGMQRDAERRADVGGRFRVRERDRPGHVGRTAVAAPRHQTAQPADGVAERYAWREHIARRPERHLVPPHVPERDRHGGDEAAVEHAARADDREQLARDSAGSDRSRRGAAAASRRPARR